ncbi:hypothetical protein HOY82DRAFT_641073 [Tuber indicum]|nr:hypothetical protein HOY82DRAFT_641073 [Tuber indicum]
MDSTSYSSSLPAAVASPANRPNQPFAAKQPNRCLDLKESNGSTAAMIATMAATNVEDVVLADVVAATSDPLPMQPHEWVADIRRRKRLTDGTTATGSGGRRSHSSGGWLGGIPISVADSSRGAGGSGSGDARPHILHKIYITGPTGGPGPESGRDAVAYVHHVQPTDALEGVVIMHNMHASALRRANGKWPNDSEQRHKILLLPVEHCGVKGAPVDLLNVDLTDDKKPKPGEEVIAEHCGYRHESYVVKDRIGQVEIARHAHKKLLLFQLRRCKESVFTNVNTGFGTPPSDNKGSVFRGMCHGAGAHGGCRGEAGAWTSPGLQNVVGVIEGFVEKWTAKAPEFETHDLIEVTQRLGSLIEDDDDRSGSGGGKLEVELEGGKGCGELEDGRFYCP